MGKGMRKVYCQNRDLIIDLIFYKVYIKLINREIKKKKISLN